ncbi:MAG: signal peptide peptidase SppA [Alphaproteobacteria bacterium]
MLKILTRLFAIIGLLVTLIILVAAIFGSQEQKGAGKIPDAAVLVLNFDEPIVEQNQPSPLQLAMHEEATPLLDVLHAIDNAKNDPKIKALVARFGPSQPSLAHSQELRAAIARFRATGKPTYAFASSYGSFGLGNRAYYLASAFEEIWLQPVGSVGLSGIAIQSPFAKTALDKIGVKPDFMQREEYKSLMETATRDDMSEPARTMMQSMIDDIANQIASGIAESRKWETAQVKSLMDKGPYTESEALKANLVTRVGYADELDEEVEKKLGVEAKAVSVDHYLAATHKKHEKSKAKIALIYGTGLIVDRNVGPADIGGEKLMGADVIAGAFNAAANDKDVKAILFRVDSPGGSPEASETIRRAVIHAQKKGKPVIVSMSDVAASGGYWISMNADRIVADAGTLTGSIGVISGKFTIQGLLEKLGVRFDTLKTNDEAGMWSLVETFTPAQRERMNALLDQTYQAFTKNVSEARKIPMEKMPEVAKGRVWTGSQALKIGLVDELGGFDVALSAIRKKLKLEEKDYMSLELFPEPETPVERVMKLLKTMGVEGAMIRSTLMQWQAMQAEIAPLWSDVSSFKKPVNAKMPAAALGAVR